MFQIYLKQIPLTMPHQPLRSKKWNAWTEWRSDEQHNLHYQSYQHIHLNKTGGGRMLNDNTQIAMNQPSEYLNKQK